MSTHSKGWGHPLCDYFDVRRLAACTPGKHHPARPVTYDAQGTVTPLTPAAHVLDVAA